jgi:hypothetical protein
MPVLPAFGHQPIPPSPNLQTDIRSGVRLVFKGDAMGTAHDHRRYAEECVAMAQRSDDDNDKALWLTLAQSWVRLAEHVARSPSDNFHDNLHEDPEEAAAGDGEAADHEI